MHWGQAWPPAPKPNVQPPPSPVETLRSRSYLLQVSADGATWRTVARVRRTAGLTDTVALRRVRVRAVRLRLTGGTGVETVATSSAKAMGILPMVQELTATG